MYFFCSSTTILISKCSNTYICRLFLIYLQEYNVSEICIKKYINAKIIIIDNKVYKAIGIFIPILSWPVNVIVGISYSSLHPTSPYVLLRVIGCCLRLLFAATADVGLPACGIGSQDDFPGATCSTVNPITRISVQMNGKWAPRISPWRIKAFLVSPQTTRRRRPY